MFVLYCCNLFWITSSHKLVHACSPLKRKGKGQGWGCHHVIHGRPLKWKRAKPMQMFYSRYLIKLEKCQILKARFIKADQLKLDDAHNCRVVALPKAFTSCRLSGSPPLSIWTMTYLPDVSWPGIFISNGDFTAAFDLRRLCAVHQWQVQQNARAGCPQKTSGCQKLEVHPKCGRRHFESDLHSSLLC